MADEITTALTENATGPFEVEGDQGRTRQHSLKDQIAADRYIKSKAATAAGTGLGFRILKLVPPGAA